MSNLGKASSKENPVVVVEQPAPGETKIYTFRGNGIQTLNLPAGTTGRVANISDIGGGNVRWSLDGSTPPIANPPVGGPYPYFETNGPYHEYDLPVDLSTIRLRGTSVNSRYSVAVICD